MISDFPVEILLEILRYLPPDQVARQIPTLNKRAFSKTCGISYSYIFARDNLMTMWRGKEVLSLIRAKREVNFWLLPLSYSAAFFTLFGFSSASIDHLDVFWDNRVNVAFQKRGRRLLPALEMALRFGRVEINASLLLAIASIYESHKFIKMAFYLQPTVDCNTAYEWAAALGNVSVILSFIELRKTPPAACIIYACEYGKLELAVLLLQTTTFFRSTLGIAFISACVSNHFPVAQYLLSNTSIDPSLNKNTALISACQKGYISIVKLLLQNELVNPSDCNNEALFLSCSNGHFDAACMIVSDSRFQATSRCNDAFILSLEKCHESISVLLLEYNLVESVWYRDALILAAKNGLAKTVLSLLQKPHHSFDYNEALGYAAQFGFLEIVKMLISHAKAVNVDLFSKRSEALFLASQNGHHLIIEELIITGANHPVALFEACSRGYFKCVEMLLTVMTPTYRDFEISCSNGFIQIFNILIKLVPPLGSSLCMAARNGYTEIVELLLLNSRFDTYAYNNSLLEAASNGHLPIVRIFVNSCPVDAFGLVNAVTRASRLGHKEIVECICSSKIRMMIPHDAIKFARNRVIKEILLQYKNKKK